MLHIAGSHGQIECFEEIHASLELEATTKENLLKSDNKNPYLMADKVQLILRLQYMYCTTCVCIYTVGVKRFLFTVNV